LHTGIRPRSRRILTSIAVGGLAAGLCAAASGPAAATAGRVSPARQANAAHAAPSAGVLAFARAALKHMDTGGPMAGHAVSGAPARTAIEHLKIDHPATAQRLSLRTQQATNYYGGNPWSGYADDNSQGNSYTQVSGSWTVPAVNCSATPWSEVVFWVGLDGWTSDTVEQAGTMTICYGSYPYYFTWWEMYPTNAIETVSFDVNPGDSIFAQVADDGGGYYSLNVIDYSSPASSFYTVQACTAGCADASAEWIAEGPYGDSNTASGWYPLSDYGTWSLADGTATSDGYQGAISDFPDDYFYSEDPAGGWSVPSGLSGLGDFTTFWVA
jgi:hypothetical protein